MLRATRADSAWRHVLQGLAAALFASFLVVAGPSAPQAEAIDKPGWLNPCNAPGGKYLCDKAEKGAKWLYDKSGADTVVDGATAAVDFATDPIGYFESKLRAGTKKMFESFGEELTGKKPGEDEDPDNKPKGGNP